MTEKTQKKRKPSAISDTEEARIQRGIAADPDNPEWTAEDFKRARPFAEVFVMDEMPSTLDPGFGRE